MEPPKPASTPRGVGISAIQDRIEKTTLEANETMTDAFQDLDRLMAKATEMVISCTGTYLFVMRD